jgi:osmoprotectant transport system ATP-binding protein
VNVAVAFRATEYRIDGRQIVGPLDLRIDRGERVVLLGRSGSGKTTALRWSNALLMPSAGDVVIAGTSTRAWDPVELRRSIGYVIQEIGLFPHFTVAENIGIVPRLKRWDGERVQRRVRELLQLVGLPPEQFASRLPEQLSGGQRQRVGLARALAADPPILLCDEPFGAVDPITRHDLQTEFRALTEQLEKTVVFVTHDVGEALLLGDRIVVLEQGMIAFIGDVNDFRASQDDVVRAFRGDRELR